jgi:hypothetical protein
MMKRSQLGTALFGVCLLGFARAASAQQDPPPLDQIIQNRTAAIALGKALFWDTAAGSDGQACASCHFHAGADNRIKNQINPGTLRTDDPTSGMTFGPTASGAATSGPNYTLRTGDFPFHQFNNPDARNSGVRFTTDDVASSACNHRISSTTASAGPIRSSMSPASAPAGSSRATRRR